MHEPVVPLHGRHSYLFGPFRLDPTNRLLLRDGQSVPLTSKVFDVLLYFVENGNRLLTKEELLRNVWPDSFVEEGNLARHVSTLRKLLGEGPQDHAYIVTIPGRGYRFVADVSEVAARDRREHPMLQVVESAVQEPGVQPEKPAAATEPPRRSSRVIQLTLGVLVTAAGVFGIVRWMQPRVHPSIPADSLTLEWRTNTGDVYAPAVSRDGAYVAYAWLTPGLSQGLRVRHVAGGNDIEVVPPVPVWYWAVRFSPRGDFVYYVIADRASNSLGTLYRVPTLGGRPERLLDHVSGHVAPSPDGRSLAFVRISAQPKTVTIMVAQVPGGEPRQVFAVEAPALVQSLDWSPDGRTLLYAMRERTSSGDRWHVGEVPAAGGARTVLVAPQAARIIAAAWVPGRREFLMSAVDPDNGLPQIWRVSYPGGTRSRLTDDLHNYKDLTVTADGRTVVAQSLGHLVQLWIAPGAEPGRSTHIASGTIRGGYDGLAWTGDDRLLHSWGERGYYDLWSMAPDGGARRRITDGGREVSDTSVSPDGQEVFFVSTRSGSPQIWRMTPDGGELRQLTHLPSRVANPIVSADGRCVYFTADPRGFPSLWKMTVDGSSPVEVRDKAIELFDLSPDGTWIAFSYRDDAAGRLQVDVDSIDGTMPSRRFEIEPIYAMRWTPDGKGLAYTHPSGSLRVQPIDGGAPYELAPARAGFMVVSFAWSRGGRYLAYTAAANPVDAIGFTLR